MTSLTQSNPSQTISQRRVDQAQRWAINALYATSEADLVARLLLAKVLDCLPTDLFIHPERLLTPVQWSCYQKLIARRAHHVPLPYLLGHCAFMDLDLIVDERVLIPRPETELLVERALDLAPRWPQPRLVDVGTGSGAIALSLAQWLPHANIFAIDFSSGALHVAHKNAVRHALVPRVIFVQADLLTSLIGPFDLIVANLPYISDDEYVALDPGIRCYEPRLALVSGQDGLDAIRTLLAQAMHILSERGVILLEIGAEQGAAVAELAQRAFPAARVEVLQDYAHLDRIVYVDLQD